MASLLRLKASKRVRRPYRFGKEKGEFSFRESGLKKHEKKKKSPSPHSLTHFTSIINAAFISPPPFSCPTWPFIVSPSKKNMIFSVTTRSCSFRCVPYCSMTIASTLMVLLLAAVVVISAKTATAQDQDLGDFTCGAGTVMPNTHCETPTSYKNIPDSTLKSCCTACQQDATCVAFVLAGRVCHLKNIPPTGPDCTPNQGATAVLGIRPPPPPPPPPPPAPKGAKNV